MEKRRNKDKKRGGEGEKSTCVDMLREDENALTYIPRQEGSKTTGNMIVGDFRERNAGAETTTATQEEGRETGKLDGTREQHSEAGGGRGKQVGTYFSSWRSKVECESAKHHPGDHVAHSLTFTNIFTPVFPAPCESILDRATTSKLHLTQTWLSPQAARQTTGTTATDKVQSLLKSCLQQNLQLPSPATEMFMLLYIKTPLWKSFICPSSTSSLDALVYVYLHLHTQFKSECNAAYRSAQPWLSQVPKR